MDEVGVENHSFELLFPFSESFRPCPKTYGTTFPAVPSNYVFRKRFGVYGKSSMSEIRSSEASPAALVSFQLVFSTLRCSFGKIQPVRAPYLHFLFPETSNYFQQTILSSFWKTARWIFSIFFYVLVSILLSIISKGQFPKSSLTVPTSYPETFRKNEFGQKQTLERNDGPEWLPGPLGWIEELPASVSNSNLPFSKQFSNNFPETFQLAFYKDLSFNSERNARQIDVLLGSLTSMFEWF